MRKAATDQSFVQYFMHQCSHTILAYVTAERLSHLSDVWCPLVGSNEDGGPIVLRKRITAIKLIKPLLDRRYTRCRGAWERSLGQRSSGMSAVIDVCITSTLDT